GCRPRGGPAGRTAGPPRGRPARPPGGLSAGLPDGVGRRAGCRPGDGPPRGAAAPRIGTPRPTRRRGNGAVDASRLTRRRALTWAAAAQAGRAFGWFPARKTP